jgi:hypothetical protein
MADFSDFDAATLARALYFSIEGCRPGPQSADDACQDTSTLLKNEQPEIIIIAFASS